MPDQFFQQGQVPYYFLIMALIVLAVMIFLSLVRLVIGPYPSDRLLTVNMMGGMVIAMIAILAILLNESYLLDIGIIYALISFLGVIVMAQIGIGVYLDRKERMKNQKEEEESEDGRS